MLGDGAERGLGFPTHIGIRVAATVFEDLDDAGTGQVEIVARIAARTVWEILQREEKDECAVDPFGLEYLQPSGTSRLVVVAESLPELLRDALKPLAPALDAADKRRRQ